MDDNMMQVPYAAYESMANRFEHLLKRLIIVIIISVLSLLITNGLWLWAWCQYDYSGAETTYEQDGEGLNNINAGIQGDLSNGAEIFDKNEK